MLYTPHPVFSRSRCIIIINKQFHFGYTRKFLECRSAVKITSGCEPYGWMDWGSSFLLSVMNFFYKLVDYSITMHAHFDLISFFFWLNVLPRNNNYCPLKSKPSEVYVLQKRVFSYPMCVYFYSWRTAVLVKGRVEGSKIAPFQAKKTTTTLLWNKMSSSIVILRHYVSVLLYSMINLWYLLVESHRYSQLQIII